MLHEILLSLSGHPSPLLRTAQAARAHEGHAPPAQGSSSSSSGSTLHLLSPPERELLAGIAHLSDLHVKLRSFGAQIAAAHPSTICRAVATAVANIHLAAFQRKVLAVEEGILKKDAGLVGAYNIVPLTAVVGEFDEWTRRMEWLWDITEFMLKRERADEGGEVFCTGAAIINRLCGELQTGYLDIEETARSLVRVAETAWVKQVSAWILYGRLPGFGADDFCVQRSIDADEVSVDVHIIRSLEANCGVGVHTGPRPAAVLRYRTDRRFYAVHRTFSQPYQGSEQSRGQHAGHGPSLVAAQGTFTVDLSSRQCDIFKNNHQYQAISVQNYPAETSASIQST